MREIHWINHRLYSHRLISSLTAQVKKNMCGLIPLYGEERAKLVQLANSTKLSVGALFSIRENLRTQYEIYNNSRYKSLQHKISTDFFNLIHTLPTSPDISNSMLRDFICKTNMPYHLIFNTIQKHVDYPNLPLHNKEYLTKLMEIRSQTIDLVRQRARNFEIKLEQFLTKLNIEYYTETDIKNNNIHTLTPDVLLKEPIDIILNGQHNIVHWIDAKNYLLSDTPFIIKSLKIQSEKYNKAFGPGAFVFNHGFDQSINLNTNVLVLDGSILSMQ